MSESRWKAGGRRRADRGLENTRPADCYHGYRIVVKDMKGKIFADTTSLLSPGMNSQEFELRPDYEVYGIASEDDGARDARGQILLSATCPPEGRRRPDGVPALG